MRARPAKGENHALWQLALKPLLFFLLAALVVIRPYERIVRVRDETFNSERNPRSFRASEASRGIAIIPVEGPLFRDDGDSSTRFARSEMTQSDLSATIGSVLAAWRAGT